MLNEKVNVKINMLKHILLNLSRVLYCLSESIYNFVIKSCVPEHNYNFYNRCVYNHHTHEFTFSHKEES